ncbi:hypothetical protein Hanom_Chr13g01215571 [Helianthus anomalus]
MMVIHQEILLTGVILAGEDRPKRGIDSLASLVLTNRCGDQSGLSYHQVGEAMVVVGRSEVGEKIEML